MYQKNHIYKESKSFISRSFLYVSFIRYVKQELILINLSNFDIDKIFKKGTRSSFDHSFVIGVLGIMLWNREWYLHVAYGFISCMECMVHAMSESYFLNCRCDVWQRQLMGFWYVCHYLLNYVSAINDKAGWVRC